MDPGSLWKYFRVDPGTESLSALALCLVISCMPELLTLPQVSIPSILFGSTSLAHPSIVRLWADSSIDDDGPNPLLVRENKYL